MDTGWHPTPREALYGHFSVGTSPAFPGRAGTTL